MYSGEVLDQAAEAPQSKLQLSDGQKVFDIQSRAQGWKRFMPLAELRTRGYLAGDRLKLRAKVKVALAP